MKRDDITTTLRWVLTATLAIFVTLKLTAQIDWSWWWVLAPIWLPLIAGVSIGMCAAVFSAIANRKMRSAARRVATHQTK